MLVLTARGNIAVIKDTATTKKYYVISDGQVIGEANDTAAVSNLITIASGIGDKQPIVSRLLVDDCKKLPLIHQFNSAAQNGQFVSLIKQSYQVPKLTRIKELVIKGIAFLGSATAKKYSQLIKKNDKNRKRVDVKLNEYKQSDTTLVRKSAIIVELLPLVADIVQSGRQLKPINDCRVFKLLFNFSALPEPQFVVLAPEHESASASKPKQKQEQGFASQLDVPRPASELKQERQQGQGHESAFASSIFKAPREGSSTSAQVHPNLGSEGGRRQFSAFASWAGGSVT